VTEATGTREASITIAEGNKQAAILEAEGKRQSTLLEAEGYALALQSINNVATGVDANTMSLQYLEALRELGASPATKMVIPTEFTNLLRPFIEHTRTTSGPEGTSRT
jgi:regulator of protease activity HflC (stomatin/prohibitin superfamily)